MDWKKEWKSLVLIVAVFLGFFYHSSYPFQKAAMKFSSFSLITDT